jgi:hypothetical protein
MPLGDTWTWDGTDWTEVTPAVSPSARSWAAMAGTEDGVVLFGGQGLRGDTWVWDGTSWTQRDVPGLRGDTWVWDGTSWTQRDVPGPTPRSGAAMAGF